MSFKELHPLLFLPVYLALAKHLKGKRHGKQNKKQKKNAPEV